MSAIYNYFLCVGKNSGSFACEAVARALGQANVPECAVGILFLSFILFTVVVFLALAVTGKGLAKAGRRNPKFSILTEPSKNYFRFFKITKNKKMAMVFCGEKC